ncbi:MAG: hypothetical protein U1F77_12790 [Kiritimatiellia bacterium]
MQRFILWPFWNEAEYFFKGREGEGLDPVPFLREGRSRGPVHPLVRPPFFKVAEGNGNRRISGPGRSSRRAGGHRQVLPVSLYGWKRIEDKGNERVVHRSFVLWPLGWRIGVTSPQVKQDNFQVLPFFYKNDRAFTDPADRGKGRAQPVVLAVLPRRAGGRRLALAGSRPVAGKESGQDRTELGAAVDAVPARDAGGRAAGQFPRCCTRYPTTGQGYRHWKRFPRWSPP